MIDTQDTIPHLTTALEGPLKAIESKLLENQVHIEAWFRKQWQTLVPPIYGSIDLRNSGFKIAPVDMNLFAAGFNNLNPEFMPLAIQSLQLTIEKRFPNCSRILIIPENHTRNTFYFENLAAQQHMMRQAGYDVRIGSLRPDLIEKQQIDLPSGKSLLLEPLIKDNNRIMVDGFAPCIVWLNNDLSEGIPEILNSIEQPITPPLQLGWSNRLKSAHFQHYRDICSEFGKIIDLDPWLINPYFRHCGEVNFADKTGIDCLRKNAKALFQQIQLKYNEYNIDHKPFLIVKADAGTYGMSVMTIRDLQDLDNLNRKQRSHMARSKGGSDVTKIILQEGVYSFEKLEEAIAEPVVYLIGQYVIGGFYRINNKRDTTENLNSPGMSFKPLAFAKACNTPCEKDECYNRFYSYSVIARLSMLAAAKEHAALKEQ